MEELSLLSVAVAPKCIEGVVEGVGESVENLDDEGVPLRKTDTVCT